jgi:hypothetical protein
LDGGFVTILITAESALHHADGALTFATTPPAPDDPGLPKPNDPPAPPAPIPEPAPPDVEDPPPDERNVPVREPGRNPPMAST